MKKTTNEKVMYFMKNNPQFKGKFIGYKESRGGLGISRIDDDWYQCEDYLISIEDLIDSLEKNNDINLK